MLLLDKLHISYFVYGTALPNASVIAKVILIREAIHAGTKCDTTTLTIPTHTAHPLDCALPSLQRGDGHEEEIGSRRFSVLTRRETWSKSFSRGLVW